MQSSPLLLPPIHRWLLSSTRNAMVTFCLGFEDNFQSTQKMSAGGLINKAQRPDAESTGLFWRSFSSSPWVGLAFSSAAACRGLFWKSFLSCPQAALASRPRVWRTLTVILRDSKVDANATTCQLPKIVYMITLILSKPLFEVNASGNARCALSSGSISMQMYIKKNPLLQER